MKKSIFLLIVILSAICARAEDGMISGRILSTDKEIVSYATVSLKKTRYGAATNEDGLYHLKAPAGTYIMVISAIGFETKEQEVTIEAGARKKLNLTIAPKTETLQEVVVVGNQVDRVNQSAFNTVAIDAKSLHNTTQDLASSLIKVPGVKIRESGGVGSDMNITLDGFSGKQIKLFIDGVPQEGVGSSFGLNNIPINFAERIEVYRGVVPVGFGTDALGGVINIVTNNKRRTYIDASYTYGSFNTHKSYVNVGHTTKSGFMFDINLFQNYSDNSYKVDVPIENFETGFWDATQTEQVKRFNDTYHNETAIAKVGLVGKSFADRLVLSFTYSQEYKEIQNGVIQSIVYGQKHRKGYSIMPALEYRKQNLFTKGLNVLLTANYNRNMTHNVDTSAYKYNWRGEKAYKGSLGEQAYQDTKFDNDNYNVTFTVNYHLGESHAFVLNHVFTRFDRKARATSLETENSSVSLSNLIDKKSRKNVTGLSYRYSYKNVWNVSVFGKYYNQYASGPKSISESLSQYEEKSAVSSDFGFGAAATYFFLNGFQAKLSYEKAVRLPTTDELFGDEDLELGTVDLKPEKSHNFNANLSYSRNFGKHTVYIEGGFIYRDTRDYIMRSTPRYSGNVYYGSQSNHGRVKTWGINAELRYNFSHWFSVGGNVTNLDMRSYERYVEAGSSRETTSYKQRMPNTPYLYSNANASFYWYNLLGKGNVLTLTYENNYVHSFTLDWENQGSHNISGVPDQFSHNISLIYSIKDSRYNVALECKNVTDAKLYDNFSLQKAGRAFYVKLRYYFNK